MTNRPTPRVFVTCLKKRLSGVTTTITNLLPVQAQLLPLGYVGPLIPGVEQAQKVTPGLTHYGFWRALGVALKATRKQPMVWHVRRDHEQVILLALRFIFRLQIRLVFTSAATRSHGKFTLWLISQMDAVIATTPMALLKIQASAPTLTRVIPHGVNARVYTPTDSKTALWQSAKLPGRYGVGIFGRVRHQKGIHIFVSAMLHVMPRYPGAVAVICGLCKPEDQAYQQALMQQISQAGLSDRFIWLGLVSQDEVLQWYRRVSITVACPLNEGFGLTVIEGMACGSAVIASRTGGFEQMVVEGETGHLVPTGDVAALAEALAKLMHDEASMAHMGQQGRKRVEMRYSIEAEAAAITEVYDLMLNPSTAAHRADGPTSGR